MTDRKSFNVLVLVHERGDVTIADMKVIDAYAVHTAETAEELQWRLDGEAHVKYGRSVVIYLQPYGFPVNATDDREYDWRNG